MAPLFGSLLTKQDRIAVSDSSAENLPAPTKKRWHQKGWTWALIYVAIGLISLLVYFLLRNDTSSTPPTDPPTPPTPPNGALLLLDDTVVFSAASNPTLYLSVADAESSQVQWTNVASSASLWTIRGNNFPGRDATPTLTNVPYTFECALPLVDDVTTIPKRLATAAATSAATNATLVQRFAGSLWKFTGTGILGASTSETIQSGTDSFLVELEPAPDTLATVQWVSSEAMASGQPVTMTGSRASGVHLVATKTGNAAEPLGNSLRVEGSFMRDASTNEQWRGYGANLHDTRTCNQCSTIEDIAPEADEVIRRATQLHDNGSNFFRLCMESYSDRLSYRKQFDQIYNESDYEEAIAKIVRACGRWAQEDDTRILVALWVNPTFDRDVATFAPTWSASTTYDGPLAGQFTGSEEVSHNGYLWRPRKLPLLGEEPSFDAGNAWLEDDFPNKGWPSSETHRVYRRLLYLFKNDPYVMFGLANEPTGSLNVTDTVRSRVRQEMLDAVLAIRAEEERLLVTAQGQQVMSVQTPDGFSNDVQFYVTNPLPTDLNIVYELHMYTPNYRQLFNDARRASVPVIMGEFSAEQAFSGALQLNELQAMLQWMSNEGDNQTPELQNISFCLWSTTHPFCGTMYANPCESGMTGPGGCCSGADLTLSAQGHQVINHIRAWRAHVL
jgi:hypothetical protein